VDRVSLLRPNYEAKKDALGEDSGGETLVPLLEMIFGVKNEDIGPENTYFWNVNL